ncbi:hypothetical protein [Candidatus Reidiella endopervernicosa]|uniref:Methyl-accepting chemotaxis protein n=1 Tax=Candidatus Reidiella endopervernicosa TaxID=2738883 RepID=A0A6N0HW13_9GAMM|nr:hypothetical protein [Candidatus Reidiella endopervernicosa]QKQ26467.1 hypothetical protein HUE57_09405 [Candidatus Reidiella endopervernicosa]
MKIAAKINLTLLAVFVTVLIASLWHSFKSTHSLVESAITQQTTDMADSYFDTINAMMLTGNMTNRQILQKKLLERPNVLEARIIRGEGIAKLFGAGFEDQKPVDELDRRALAGEAVIEDVDGEEGSYLTVVTPLRASADYRGTNCLLCHQVPEGTVLGAVRVSYSADRHGERSEGG